MQAEPELELVKSLTLLTRVADHTNSELVRIKEQLKRLENENFGLHVRLSKLETRS